MPSVAIDLAAPAAILRAEPATAPLQGELTPPGDKSISHRAVILSSLAGGRSRISGLLMSEDVKATMNACRQLGVTCAQGGQDWLIDGLGLDGLTAPRQSLDMGNSGTAMRLLAGVLAAQPFRSELVGDLSLSRRPMRRIVEPLSLMGASIHTTPTGTAPLLIDGNPRLRGIDYALPVASAQVKSCLLLAGLYATGETRLTEPGKSRDHTERMLETFGVPMDGECRVSGGSRLRAAAIAVPGDISSASFFLLAAAAVNGSELLLRNVGLNETRDGILRVMQAMGADVSVFNRRRHGTEPAGDIRIRYCGRLRGIEIPADWVPSMIDEMPAIMALAAVSEGLTRIRGAEELRVKESDRIAVMARGLTQLGVAVREFRDGIDIVGGRISGGEVDGAGDHRCAMSFAILGQVAAAGIEVHGAGHIDTSYPSFARDLESVGGQLKGEPPEHDD
jgi:3-phosphoshikimate 1-carboxyvinyltransferase